jgi:hypothetical protein
MDRDLSTPIIAESLARSVTAARGKDAAAADARDAGVDVHRHRGLCVAARNMSYVRAALDSWEANGSSTAIGHLRTLDAGGRRVRERHRGARRGLRRHLRGRAGARGRGDRAGVARRRRAPSHCRPRHAVRHGGGRRGDVPRRHDRAQAHPQGGLPSDRGAGRHGRGGGVAAALKVDEKTFASAQGIAGSMASGIIEYLSEGASTKRMHPGWAAQAGMRAVDLARAGFEGPRTVWEGPHGFMHGFANTMDGAWDAMTGGFGERWVSQTIAFKPYACGT